MCGNCNLADPLFFHIEEEQGVLKLGTAGTGRTRQGPFPIRHVEEKKVLCLFVEVSLVNVTHKYMNKNISDRQKCSLMNYYRFFLLIF